VRLTPRKSNVIKKREVTRRITSRSRERLFPLGATSYLLVTGD
jgi:hypothetical protein